MRLDVDFGDDVDDDFVRIFVDAFRRLFVDALKGLGFYFLGVQINIFIRCFVILNLVQDLKTK